MIRLKELKIKDYNPKFEELFKFLYSINIDEIVDFERTEKDNKLNVEIIIKGMKKQIRLIQFKNEEYVISVFSTEEKSELNYKYDKNEYYTFKTITSLVEKLRELIGKYSNIITVEYDRRPFKSIYDLIAYAKIEVIGDDSSWKQRDGSVGLSLVLYDAVLDKTIFVSCSDYSYYDKYTISYFSYKIEDKNTPNEYVKFILKDETEMYEKLKELISPCLRKRRMRCIGYEYKRSLQVI